MNYRVNIGCGQNPTKGWRNFDNSPALRLAKSPLKRSLARAFGLLDKTQLENIEWNRRNSIEFADATNRIPLPDASAIAVYSSHMFEHLSRDGARKFLEEAKRVLKTGGVLRLVVPDLQYSITAYNRDGNADRFMDSLLVAPPLQTFKDRIKLAISGHRHHQWMYDGKSLSQLLQEAGFKDVTVQTSGNTLIEDPGELDLHEREEGSVVVEGRI